MKINSRNYRVIKMPQIIILLRIKHIKKSIIKCVGDKFIFFNLRKLNIIIFKYIFPNRSSKENINQGNS